MSYQNLFVTKLPRTYTDSDLSNLFAEYAPQSTTVMLDPTSGRSKGFGFAYFNSEEEGKTAFNALNGTRRQCGRRTFTVIMQPSTHNGRTAAAESCALYVRNIPISASQLQVEAMFGHFGTIVEFAMRQDYHSSGAWVVYVEFAAVSSATAALRALHRTWTNFPGGVAPVLAKYAENDELKQERRSRLKRCNIQEECLPTSTCAFDAPASDEEELSEEDLSILSDTRCSSSSSYRHNPYSFHTARIIVC